MERRASAEITALLAAWKNGDAESFDLLVEQVYPELRRMARQQLVHRPGESMVSAALANEAYLKLARAGRIGCENRAHFLALCAQVMRRILVDHARERAAVKRGGDAARVPLDDAQVTAAPGGVDLLMLDEALEALSKLDARKSRVVELRYIGGLSFEETAEALGVSVQTAKRDWRLARAWLIGALGTPDTVSTRERED